MSAIAGLASLSGGQGGLDAGGYAATGSQRTDTSKTYSFSGPQINKTDWTKAAIIAGVAVVSVLALKKVMK